MEMYERWLKCLTNFLSNIPRLDRKDIIFMGDFNVDLLTNSPETNRLIRFSKLSSLIQTINTPQKNIANLINRLWLTQNSGPACEGRTFPITAPLNGPCSWNDHTKLRMSMHWRIS